MSAFVRELSPRGSGAVCVLELFGEHALELFSRHSKHAGLSPGKLSLVRLSLGGEELDEALVWCESPSRLELHLHGSPPLVERVQSELFAAGFERGSASASPRTLEQRAWSELARARSPASARMLLDQAEGALRAELESCARLRGDPLRERLALLHSRARRARYLLAPPRIVLAGPVNAGKSTLFNALVGSDRALVSAHPGTTRDVVCEPTRMGDWPVLLYDTAGERALGERDAARAIEAEGQALGRRARDGAELVLWLCPADKPELAIPAGALAITTRADLGNAKGLGNAKSDRPALAAGPQPLLAAQVVARAVLAALDLPERAWEPGAGVPFEAWMEARLEWATRSAEESMTDPLEQLDFHGLLAELGRDR